MKLIHYLLALTISITQQQISISQRPECDMCLQSVCANVSSDQCMLLFVSNDTAEYRCIYEECTTGNLNSVVQCNAMEDHLVYFLDSSSRDCLRRNISTPTENGEITSGVYTFAGTEFCEDRCIERVRFRAKDARNLNLDAIEDAIEFHVYRRFTNSLIVLLYVQQLHFSFNVTLRYNEDLDLIEATPKNTQPNSLCVEMGESFGFTIRDDIVVLYTGEGSTSSRGVTEIENSLCSGSANVVNQNDVLRRIPLMTVLYESDTPPPDTPTTPDGITTSEDTISDTRTTDVPTVDGTSTMPTEVIGSSNSLTTVVGAGVGGGVAVAVLITLIIITLLCLHFRKKQAIDLAAYKSNGNFGNDDLISMTTNNSQYMETVNFSPPIRYSNGVETVVNPLADEDLNTHDYHEPYEMNGASAHSRALPNLPVLHNVQYDPINRGILISTPFEEPSSPQYQDPDVILKNSPRERKLRNTLKNPLYSPTGALRLEMEAYKQSTDSLTVPIYDEPHELAQKDKDDANLATHEYHVLVDPTKVNDERTPPPQGQSTSSGGPTESAGGIYGGEDSDSDEEITSSMADYSTPINAGIQRNSSGTPEITNRLYREFDPNDNVIAESTGHHYHILEDNADSSGNEEDFLVSTAHHIVNESGAYVPNAEERRELLSDNNHLSPKTFETWKKTSIKEKKFFMKSETYWTPSTTEQVLFDQLNQKKFREIMKDDLRFEAHLGEGNFGSVQRAKLSFAGVQKDVAVKIMKASAVPDAKVRFLQEAAILGQFFHSNVIKLYGVATLNFPVMIVMEYMPLGDLNTYLCKNYRPTGAAPPNPKTLLSFCRQTACGMKYLAKKKFVHRDLAARNIFVSETLVCKIGDFGMSRNLLDESYYISHGGLVPIKWTAPEGLCYKKYSSASDVYSFGMTMYEIWSLGEKPLRDIPLEHVANTVTAGYCQPPPPGTTRKIYDIMVQCWNPNYNKRPSFDDLFEILNGPDKDLLGWSNEDKVRAVSPEAMIIGSLLEHGKPLYKDLQVSYHGITPDLVT